ncbi:MAG: DUF2332 family protein [Pseudomonadota bacterium]
MEDAVRASFAQQAIWCAQLGSPFTARLLEGIGRAIDRKTATGRRVLDWPGVPDATGDAVALRLAGALHNLVRNGRAGDLAALYPPAMLPAANELTVRAMAAIEAHDSAVARFLDFAPQTNEVARSALLYAGFMEIGERTGLPLSLFELGASAGLNMIADRYGYLLGDRQAGDVGSPVQISPEWEGGAPEGADPVIIDRAGCDLSPLDLSVAEERERMLAYIWPDQPARMARIEAAIGLALAELPRIDRADAGSWIVERLSRSAGAGQVRVLYHSIAFQYFPAALQDEITAHMAALGARATETTPLAWLSFENVEGRGAELTLRLWPGGDVVTLALADAHVRRVRWRV